MGSFFQLMVAITAVLAIFNAEPGVTRSVNISSSWLLPQYDFPVFYRHFRDRVTWFEADAVCQFHHAQLATVESNNQFEAIRSYLKELDVTENVWIGLKRNNEASEFTWTNYQPLARGGYFREEVPRSSDPVCVVTDPTANFKWHSLHCGGPEVASFVCELPVPYWASKSNGCMTSMMEGMTVTFLPERPAIQLTKECGPGISTNVTCNGNMEPSDINEKLSCANANKQQIKYSKSVRPILPDIMFKTTTSSSESDVEDYAIEMATIAQYNDETFQSISKVMGRGGNGAMVNLPQEMSIALEPIKSSSGRSFDTNGIDSAFMNAMMADTTSSTTLGTPSTTTTTTTTSAPSTTTTTAGTPRTTTTTGAPSTTSTAAAPSTTSTVAPSTSTMTGAPSTVAATTVANKIAKTERAEATTAATTTAAAATTKQPVPSTTTTTTRTATSATRTTSTTATRTDKSTTTTGSTRTDSTTEVPAKPTQKSRTPVYATVTRAPPTNRPIVYGTPVTTTAGRRRPIVAAPANDDEPAAATSTTERAPVTPSPADAPMTTTAKLRTIAKILNQAAAAGDNPGPATDATPIIASLASLATTLANQIASTGRPPVTGGFADALHSLLRGDDHDVPTRAATPAARETTTTAGVTPMRVYKKIDLQPIMPDFEAEMPGHNRKHPDYFPYYHRPAKVTSTADTVTGQTNGTVATTAATTAVTGKPTTQPITVARPTTAISTQTTADSTTTAGVITAAANVSVNDNAWNPLTPPSTPSSDPQTAEAAVSDASTPASADVSATAATTTAATGTNAASAFTTTTVASTASMGTTATTAATTTAAVNNRRKVNNNYDAYTEHPNRNRHIVRPKQQHHHSYPYILYRLLG